MKYPVRRFVSATVALSELSRYVQESHSLRTGRPSKAFADMRPREMWANWLLCAAINAAEGRDDFEFTTDPTGGDGIIRDNASGNTWPTEHVYVPPTAGEQVADVEALILAAIDAKNDKGGAAYAENKTLVIFIDAAGPWHPNRVLKRLIKSHHFDVVWLISLHAVEEGGAYDYDVIGLYWDQGNVPIWRVRIAPEFDTWSVHRVQ